MEFHKGSTTSKGEEKNKEVEMVNPPYVHNSPKDNVLCNDPFVPQQFDDEPISIFWPESQVPVHLPELSSSISWPVLDEIPDNTSVPNDPINQESYLDMIAELTKDDIQFLDGSEANKGKSVGQENIDESQTFSSSLGTYGFGNSGELPDWSFLPLPPACSYCQILREICHTNGKEFKKLEIHGELKIFTHAILRIFYPDELSFQNAHYKIFDFSKLSFTDVKDFLVKYCEDCKREGYEPIPDPLSDFYGALSVGINENNSCSPMVLEGRNETGPSRPKKNFVVQRKRTAKMTLKDFTPYFHLNLGKVAEMLDVSTSFIKKRCREGGLAEWPFKKKSDTLKRLNTLEEKLPLCSDQSKAQILEEIVRLQQVLIDIDRELSDLVIGFAN